MAARDYILNNFWVKIFSLLLATMIWRVINTWQEGGHIERPRVVEPRTFNRLAVTVLKSPTDDRSFRVVPSAVDVTLSGSPENIHRLSVRDVEVFVNLTGVIEAEGLIKRVQVFYPPTVTLDKVNPPEVRVERLQP